MLITKVFIEDIRVGERRREDFGDIEGLAASIEKYGLFHPIILDDKNGLLAGERRLIACQKLGWKEIPARLYSDLTDEEKAEIELEENLRRKDLTPYEASKNIVALAETAAGILKNEFSPTVGKNPKGGRPAKPDADEKVAERIGIPRQTIERAEQHVEAVTKYPELTVVPTQKAAIEVAKKLDKMSEGERNRALSNLINQGKQAIASITNKPKAQSKPKPASGKYAANLSQIQVFISTIQSVGAEDLTATWTQQEIFSFLRELTECRDGMSAIVADLERVVSELKRRAG
jgi:ParB-like chromosome segregation protein Spo0J